MVLVLGGTVDESPYTRSDTSVPERADLGTAPAQAGSGAEDRQLVRAAALGDQVAWNTLADKHSGPVWQLANSWTTQRDEAVAVFELVWCRLAQVLPDLDGLPLTEWLAGQVDVEAGYTRRRTGRAAAPALHERRRQPRAGLA